jgi:spermidine synthase
MNVRSRRALLLGVTFVVAFCSIAYELVYSELLRVVFGGTVVRYSITIGLFLFSLGIGALLFNYLDVDRRDFFRVEVALAVVGPLGLVYVILLNTAVVPRPWTGGIDPLLADVVLVLSHVPIVLVGVLSGLEVPFLATMVETERSAFSEVLGIDYVGSLAGTVVWALVLYPSMGIIAAVFLLGLLNAVVAVAFHLRFGRGSRVLLAACLLVVAAYGGVLLVDDRVEDSLTRTYLESEIESEYDEGMVEVGVRERFTTRYQDVVLYDRNRQRFGREETCLRLDMHLQLCDSWVESYHSGLVDVPMSAIDDPRNASVLLVGGGDWIAIDHLREYGVQVDHVDLDGEFMEYAKDDPFFEQYHDDAYEYERLDTTVADAYDYLRRSQQRYDAVFLDLPGARSDDMLPLYSEEFYTLLRQHLTDRGFVATWSYSRYAFPRHHKAYMNTVGAAGFEHYLSYRTLDNLSSDPGREIAEGFYLLSPEPRPELHPNRSKSAYVRRLSDRFAERRWRSVPYYDGVRVNSVFHPNYAVIVDY